MENLAFCSIIIAYLMGAMSVNERVIYKKLTVAEQMGERN